MEEQIGTYLLKTEVPIFYGCNVELMIRTIRELEDAVRN